jgi:hypothetical protein
MSTHRPALLRAPASAVSIVVLALCLNVPAAFSQSKSSLFRSDDLHVSVSDADRASAQSAVRVYKHAYFSRTPVGLAARHQAAQPHSAGAKKSSSAIAGDDFTQNPGDVTYQGGPTVAYAVSHAVYVNPGGACTIASCWGNPEGFLDDVGESDFIHVLDQYVGLFSSNRYTLGRRAVVTAPLVENPLSESDLIAILHGVVAKTGAGGYGNIYHLFLPPGVDTCFDAPANNVCYSPDNPATFAFCAYHNSVTYSDLGHVLFTVEPWQGPTSGCEDSPVGAPNGQLTDSTDDTLSHELFETISDPDGDAWWNDTNLALGGNEIGDECLFFGSDGFLILPTFFADGHLYRTQSEYSNEKHACAISPHF